MSTVLFKFADCLKLLSMSNVACGTLLTSLQFHSLFWVACDVL